MAIPQRKQLNQKLAHNENIWLNSMKIYFIEKFIQKLKVFKSLEIAPV